MDLAGASAGLMLTSPVIAATALAIRWRMGSPVLFRQIRTGQNGDSFTILKFRTMRNAAPGEDQVSSDGQRMTPLGRFLRSTSIDELPSLWNVIVGEMSLVGPRPLLVQYRQRYSVAQARRLEVKPGLTGWCQVNGRNSLSWDDKFRLDLWYVDNASTWTDLGILVATVGKVLRRQGIAADGAPTMPEFLGEAAPQ
jgi:lipopolysaccharide/colanic/teichoic acid biosynthesis glycosyltransferase